MLKESISCHGKSLEKPYPMWETSLEEMAVKKRISITNCWFARVLLVNQLLYKGISIWVTNMASLAFPESSHGGSSFHGDMHSGTFHGDMHERRGTPWDQEVGVPMVPMV